MSLAPIPESYEQWHHCIKVICRQPLSLPYIESRIQALSSDSDYMTRKFVELYGNQQRLKTLQWFEQAKDSVSAA